MHRARNWVRWIFPFSELRRERSWETRRERSHGFPRGCHNRCTWAYKWMLEMNALSWQSKQSLAATLHMLKWTQIGAKCTFASLAFQISSQRKSERASSFSLPSYVEKNKMWEVLKYDNTSFQSCLFQIATEPTQSRVLSSLSLCFQPHWMEMISFDELNLGMMQFLQSNLALFPDPQNSRKALPIK